jgi:osmotically-inducible protein OsmY
MKLLTVLAAAALVAGIYHYRRYDRARLSRRDKVDERLAHAVRSALAGRASARVQVRCVKGTVTLSGTLPAGDGERDVILAAALAVPGVAQVTNLIETTEPVGDLGPMQSGIATGA